MSKIGKMPVIISEGVNVRIEDGKVLVNGPKGDLFFAIPRGIIVATEDGKVIVSQKKETSAITRPLFGLTRAIVANMVEGVSVGFQKKLELTGVGYRALASGRELTLSVGFSHPVKIKAPEGVTFSMLESTIVVSGIDKTLVGNVAAQVRAVRPPEPYKGKGIKYFGEKVRRKAGKAAKAVGAK